MEGGFTERLKIEITGPNSQNVNLNVILIKLTLNA